MQPPQELNVIDQHGGFTAITTSPTNVKIVLDLAGEREARLEDYNPTLALPFVRWEKVTREHDTLWRPGTLLKQTTVGTLQEFDEHSFYQLNDNVTKAIYKVPGYKYRVAVWFDNTTGNRIA